MKVGDVKDRLMPMLEDARWAEQTLNREDSQFTRRAYIRTTFAMIEGVIWALKETVLHAPVLGGKVKRLSAAEYALLSDKTYDLKSNGDPAEQTKYLRLPENIRFTFGILTKYFGIQFDLGVGTAAWDYLLAAHKIRHRITHPKTSHEFSVTDDEIETCKKAFSWFNDLVFAFFNGLIGNADKDKRKHD